MKKKTIKSALPIYACALVWVICAFALNMYSLSGILICAGLSAAAWFLASLVFKGREVEVAEDANSGDKEVDRQINEGREALMKIRALNEALPDPGISARIDRLERAGGQIFAALEKEPRKALSVRKFMSYYLPTTVKLLEKYKLLHDSGSGGENVSKTLSAVENSLEMIAVAFEKQLDSLYGDTALDVTTDIDVLETMLASEGLADGKGKLKAL